MSELRHRRGAAKTSEKHTSQSFVEKDVKKEKPIAGTETSFVPLQIAFFILLGARLISAFYNIITDCDETYNYWEPLHYLMYGFGMQTWEYSSEFALRSWSYLLMHSIPMNFIYNNFYEYNKIYGFYLLRCLFAIVSTCSETLLLLAIRRRFSPRTADVLFLLLLFNTGMFISSTAFLASSFSMWLTTTAIALWLLGWPRLCVVIVFVSSFLGWPFASATLLFVAVDLLRAHGVARCVLWNINAFALVVVPSAVVDAVFFRSYEIPAFNIVRYNVLNSDTSSTLYGTEPLMYYVRNLLLNFNVALLLAVAGVLIVVMRREWRQLQVLAPMLIWFAIMFPQPHKEERFLFIVYPIICLSASIAMTSLWRYNRIAKAFVSLLFVTYAIVSVSRSTALVGNYGAPLRMWSHVSQITDEIDSDIIGVCVGQEWHRFPSSFFLPRKQVRLFFVEAGFHGLLPAPFDTFPRGAWQPAPHMNRFNREEKSRYVGVDRCDFFVDLHDDNGADVREWRGYEWRVEHVESFVERETNASPSFAEKITQWLYVPTVSERVWQRNQKYVLYRRL